MEDCKRYYIGGEQVTPEQAEEQKRINDAAMATDDPAEWLKCKIILVFQNGKLCGM